MKKAFDKKKLLLLALFIMMVAAQLTRIIYVFTQREGFHSDESWSYGMANSYYDPYIYMDVQDDIYLSDTTVKNLNEWKSGSILRDYLMVNEGEEFSYGSIYMNQRGDMSPPLHSMILHTICSLFPETFSWWYSFSINIVLFVLTQIVFYALVKTVTGKDWASFLICGYYGFSYAAVNTFVYLRQYAMSTFWTLLLVYLLARMYRKDFHKITKECILSVIVTLLGGFTHYYFMVLAFFVAAFTCIYLLIRKRWKALTGYAATMLAGAGLSILSYPYSIGRTFSAYEVFEHGLQWPYYWNLSTCLSMALNEIVGFYWRVNRVTFAWLSVILLVLVLIFLAVWFVCRNESWMIHLLEKIRMWLKNWKSNCKRVISGWNPFLIVIFLSVVANIMVVAKISAVENMGELSDRYLFHIMPLLLMALCLFLLYLARRYLPGKRARVVVCTVVILGCMFLNQTSSYCRYMFESNCDEAPLYELTADSDVVVAALCDWSLEWYCYELRNAHGFFMTEGEDCINCTEQLNDYVPEPGRDVYLILEESLCKPEDAEEDEEKTYEIDNVLALYHVGEEITEKEYLEYLENSIDWIDSVEYMYTRDSFCGILYIYKIHVKEA